MLFFCVLLAAATSEPAAESDVFAILEEEQRVSIGSRVEQKITESTSSVWVIDKDMIRLSGASTMPDLLRLVPGMFVADWSTSESNVAVRTIGTQFSSRILLLVDNRSVVGTFGEAAFNDIPVHIAEIERIEVVMGPASTAYGTNAYSGVVNIVTRKPTENGWRAYAQGQGGAGWATVGGKTPTLGSAHPIGDGFLEYSQGLHSDRAGDFGFRLSVSGTFLSGAEAVDKANSSVPIVLPPDAQKGVLNGDVTWRRGDWQARLQLSGVINQFQTVDEELVTHQHASTYAANLEVNGQNLGLKGDKLTIQTWVRQLTTDGLSLVPALNNVEAVSKDTSVELLLLYTLPELFYNRLTVGFQGRMLFDSAIQDHSSLLSADGQNEQLVGLFAEDQFRPLRWLIVDAGIRIDAEQTSAWRALSRVTPSPRAAVVFIPVPQHSFRLEYASAFRDPTLLEQFITERVFNAALLVSVPNTALLPEQHQVFSFGYQGHFGMLRARAEAFYGIYSGVIQEELVTQGNPFPVHFVNNERDDEYGASGALDLTPAPFLRLFAHYTFAESRNLSLPSGSARVLGTSPHHNAAVGGFFTMGRIEAGVQGYFIGPYAVPDAAPGRIVPHIILNATCGVWVDAPHRVQLFTSLEDAGDIRIGSGVLHDYPDQNSPRVGTRVWVGARLNLGSERALR